MILMINAAFLNAQSVVTIPVSPNQKGITIVGEKVFQSPYPKTEEDTIEPLRLNYSLVFKNFFKLEPGTHGITGTIDKPGGKITLEVFAYTPNEPDGIQKMTLPNGTKIPRIVYSCYIDKSTKVGQMPRAYQAQTTQVDYGYLYDRNQPDKITAYSKAESTNLKVLGSGCRNGYLTPSCVSTFWSSMNWIAAGLRALDFFHPRDYMNFYECSDVAENYQGGTQPVIVRVTVKDATLEDFAVPAMSINGLKALNIEYKTIKVINKLKITILEPAIMHEEVDYYKKKIAAMVKQSNRHFNNLTGRIRPKEIKAELGDFGIVFKNIDVVVKKAAKKKYDRKDKEQIHEMISEFDYAYGDSRTSIHIVFAMLEADGIAGGSVTINEKGVIGIYPTSFILHDFSYMFYVKKEEAYHGVPSTIFSHELGHYFGLYHTFEGGCNGGDLIDDTPQSEGPFWYVASGRVINNPCGNAPVQCGQRRQIENLMDYGPCRWLFTKGQVDYMNRVIATAPGLYTSVAVLAGSELPALNIKVTDLRNASGKISMKSETIEDDRASINIEDETMGEEIAEKPLPDLKVYPNPTEGALHLDYIMQHAGTAHLSIRDLFGKVVYEEQFAFSAGRNNHHLENLKLLPHTLYILKFDSEAIMQTVKLISQ